MSAKKEERQKEKEQEEKKEQTEQPEEQERPEEDQEPEGQAPAADPREEEIDALKKQLEELNNRMLRTLAEYDNFRKRSQRERLEIYPEAVAATVAKFLPVLDNFERALSSECADPEFRKGVEMIFSALQESLTAIGVEEIAVQQGAAFDPAVHNAVLHVEDDALGDNVVAQVLQKGYRIGDKVLRHAMVQVAN